MSQSTSNGRGRRCPVCGRGILRSRKISEVFEYGEEGDTVLVRTQDVPVEDCDACGESFSGPQAGRIRHEAIGHALGLLPPQDIRAIRERLGQSTEPFARLVGVKADRLSQWEDGTLWQDRTADRLIRLLTIGQENVDRLEALIKGESDTASKLGPQARPASSNASDDEATPPPARTAETRPMGGIRRIAVPRRDT